MTRKDAEFYDIVFFDQKKENGFLSKLDKNTVSKMLEDIEGKESSEGETEKKKELNYF